MAVPTPTAVSRSHNIFDTVLAAAIVVAAAAFLAFVQVRTGTGRLTSYEFTAPLPTADGLSIGSDVRLSGIKIGSVSGLSLDPVRYTVFVRISLRDDIGVPVDSVLVAVEPALGNSYLSISPGRSSRLVAAGEILPGKTPTKGVAP